METAIFSSSNHRVDIRVAIWKVLKLLLRMQALLISRDMLLTMGHNNNR